MRACLLALVLTSSFASVALAQDPVPGPTGTARVTVMERVIIVGRRQLPMAVFLSRAPMHYRAPELERRATDAIALTVAHPPF